MERLARLSKESRAAVASHDYQVLYHLQVRGQTFSVDPKRKKKNAGVVGCSRAGVVGCPCARECGARDCAQSGGIYSEVNLLLDDVGASCALFSLLGL